MLMNEIEISTELDNPNIVKIVDGFNHLSEKSSGIMFREAACLVESIKEFTSFTKTTLANKYSVTM